MRKDGEEEGNGRIKVCVLSFPFLYSALLSLFIFFFFFLCLVFSWKSPETRRLQVTYFDEVFHKWVVGTTIVLPSDKAGFTDYAGTPQWHGGAG